MTPKYLSKHQQVRVLVHGVLGKMGKTVLEAVCKSPGTVPVGGVDILAQKDFFTLPDNSGEIPLSTDLAILITQSKPDVIVDFSVANAAMSVIRASIPRRVNVVIGTTGLSQEELEETKDLCSQYQTGAVIAPNFALGAVLLTHISRIAGKFFDYADITEIHHETKIDAPSGTSLGIAEALAESKGNTYKSPKPDQITLDNTRGGEVKGINIHSGRMPGKLAYHSIVLGTQGQTLTMTHDTINRECYMPGVIIAIIEVIKSQNLTVGLEKVLGLK